MGNIDKIFVPLSSRPLISYSLDVLQNSPHVDEIVLVMSPENIVQGRKLVTFSAWSKAREVCIGGSRRQDSVRLGLEKLTNCDLVIVQDGARPFISSELIEVGLREAKESGASIPAVPVKDTIKSAGPDMIVSETVPREGLWAVQTPQFFSYHLLLEAHNRVSDDVTDDASMVERIGGKIHLFAGSYSNIKVTTPEDLFIAEAILKSIESPQHQENS